MKAAVGRLAHDFNNSLVPILGFVTLLRDETREGTAAVEYLNSIENSARLAEKKIETIFMATRPQRRHHPRVTDFSALVSEEFKALQGRLAANIVPSLEVCPCTLTLDPEQWRAVVQHLFQNAALALPMGGAIDVRLIERTLSPAEQEEFGLGGAGVMQLTVRDDGVGMSPEVCQRACEPFFSTRNKGHGQGLGLTIVHGVTRFQGGEVLLESSPGNGTTVTLLLPKPV